MRNPSNTSVIEHLLILSFCMTLHFMCFLLGWNICCLLTLIGTYFSTLQLYIAVMDTRPCLAATTDNQDEMRPVEQEDSDSEELAEDSSDTLKNPLCDDSAEHTEVDDSADHEYDDMPDLIPLNPSAEHHDKVYTQLQQVVNETNNRNDLRRLNTTGTQIKQALIDLQEMINNARLSGLADVSDKDA